MCFVEEIQSRGDVWRQRDRHRELEKRERERQNEDRERTKSESEQVERVVLGGPSRGRRERSIEEL